VYNSISTALHHKKNRTSFVDWSNPSTLQDHHNFKQHLLQSTSNIANHKDKFFHLPTAEPHQHPEVAVQLLPTTHLEKVENNALIISPFRIFSDLDKIDHQKVGQKLITHANQTPAFQHVLDPNGPTNWNNRKMDTAASQLKV